MVFGEYKLRKEMEGLRLGGNTGYKGIFMRHISLQEDMLWLIGSEEGLRLADAVIQNGETPHHVHKSVVWNRLGCGGDQSTKIILRKNVSDIAMKMFLCFLYTGKIGKPYLTESQAEELTGLADELNFEPLKAPETNSFKTLTSTISNMISIDEKNKNTHYDIKIKSLETGETIHASKALLSARCGFFEEAFQPGKWQQDDTIDLDIKGSVLNDFATFIGMGTLSFIGEDLERAYGLAECAAFLDFEPLRTASEKYISHRLTVENACVLWNVIQDLNASIAHETALSFIVLNFAAVSNTPSFPLLRKELLKEALSQGDITSPTPTVVSCIKMWVSKQEGNTERLLEELMPPNTLLNQDTKAVMMGTKRREPRFIGF
eukprot:TRINITY_DN6959_c0_g1_i1.p1 TRINITY_DN6959_c0_g1~~TRINITY_DN6959_c0_g1_i1.p1  ORF type:complete len:387 (+),score=75.58 TRINITY_DN6959_c0_g1_i1:36-1163(+)